MIPADAATLAAERDAYRALYEQERADRQMLQAVVRSQALTIETQKALLRAQTEISENRDFQQSATRT